MSNPVEYGSELVRQVIAVDHPHDGNTDQTYVQVEKDGPFLPASPELIEALNLRFRAPSVTVYHEQTSVQDDFRSIFPPGK